MNRPTYLAFIFLFMFTAGYMLISWVNLVPGDWGNADIVIYLGSLVSMFVGFLGFLYVMVVHRP